MSVSDTVQDDEFTSPLVCSETQPPPMSSSTTLGLSSASGLDDFIQQHINPQPSLGHTSLGHCLPLEDPAGATLHLLPLDSPELYDLIWSVLNSGHNTKSENINAISFLEEKF